MKKTAYFTAAVIAAFPMVASAEITGELGVSFGQLTDSDFEETIDTRKVDFELDYKGDGPFGFGVYGGTSSLSFEGDTISMNDLTGEVSYSFGNDRSAGVYLSSLTIDNGFFSDSETAYGAFYEANYGQFDVSAAIGQVDFDGYVGNEASLHGQFNLSEKTKIAGTAAIHWDDLDTINSLSLSASHEVFDNFSVFGGLNRLSGDLPTFNTFAVGLAYDLAAVSSFSATGWVEYARTNVDDGPGYSLDRVSFGLSLPLGERSGVAPMSSVTRGINAGDRSAYFSIVTSGAVGFF